MLDEKTLIGALVVIIFTALVRTFSRRSLGYALLASVSLYLLVVWRDWVGEAYASLMLAFFSLGAAVGFAGLLRIAASSSVTARSAIGMHGLGAPARAASGLPRRSPPWR